MTRGGWAIVGIATVVVAAAKQRRRLRRIYAEEVSSGARPIEAVGTAIAAFVGLLPDKR